MTKTEVDAITTATIRVLRQRASVGPAQHLTHALWIRRGRTGPGKWRPVCSCGWKGPDQAREGAAEQDATDHVEQIMPPSRLNNREEPETP